MSTQTLSSNPALKRTLGTAFSVLMMGVLYLPPVVANAATASPLPISQVPLQVVQPTHPQVLFAIGNSQSMDGDLSGAIMTGSGALSSALSSLSSSSSPTNYTVPTGFTPPVNAGSSGSAPYTVTTSGVQYDNSASRLNVAKAGISAILNQYVATTDFGLVDYNASVSSVYTTWVYYMSPSGGFTFTNTAPTSGEYVNNPCYNYSSASSTVKSNCSSIASQLYSSISSYKYMNLSASSDDPSINDVLYAGAGLSGVFDTYNQNGSSPNSPFPPNFTLSNYNNGQISVGYNSSSPNNGGFSTNPTNAGYVPYSTQVMYVERGFGYDSTASATTSNTVVPITSAGASPTSTSVQNVINTFSPYLQPETNSSNTSEIKALAVQSPLAGLLKGAGSVLSGSLPSTSTGCSQPKQYVVLITDGLPTEDLKGLSWPPLGSASGNGYGVTATFNSDGSLNTTNDQALTDTITELKALSSAGVETYIIGLGAGVNPSNNSQAANTLSAMAVAGGSATAAYQITGSTQYFPATTPAALVNDLQSILQDVQGQSSSASAAAANSTSLGTNTYIYDASFTPGISVTNAWIGDLKAFSISQSAVISTTATWSAQAQLDTETPAARYIATWDPYHLASATATTYTPQGVGFDWANLSSTLQTELQQNSTNGPNLVSYLRGDHSQEQDNGGLFRTREHVLGDIVDSSPVYVGTVTDYYPDTSFNTFQTSSTVTNRTPMVYVGANDGMLHGFNANTGQETMAFIPNGGTGGVFSNLYLLASPYYFYHHQFFVDGSPQVGDALISVNGTVGWHSMLVGGENAGGSSIYALDVTNPGNFTSDATVASSVLWEFTDSNMGLSYSSPQIARSNAVTVTDPSTGQAVNGFAVIFGNGYNSPTERPFFYAVDASTGKTLVSIDLCNASGVPTTACNSSVANGLSSVAVANSSGVVGAPADMAYAGDLQGNLWAINMSNSSAAKWTVQLLFQARDASGNAQPITSVPAVTLNPNYPTRPGLMAFFGTGQLLTQADLTSSNTQSFYGVWDNTSSLSQYPTSLTPSPPYTRSNLQSQTISVSSYTPTGGTAEAVVLSTSNTVNLTYQAETITNPAGATPPTITLNPQEGWYFDLSPLGSGTRVYTTPQVEAGGVVFTTNMPPATSCAQPSSYLMNVNYATGGPFQRASLGLNGGVSLGGSVNGAYPTGVFLGSSYSSSPTSILTQTGNEVQIINTGNQPQAVATGGPLSYKVGWWQVQ